MQVKVGQKVVVRKWGGNLKTVIVDEVHKDVKNGRPGIDYTDPNPYNEFERRGWCYEHQIVQVIQHS